MRRAAAAVPSRGRRAYSGDMSPSLSRNDAAQRERRGWTAANLVTDQHVDTG